MWWNLNFPMWWNLEPRFPRQTLDCAFVLSRDSTSSVLGGVRCKKEWNHLFAYWSEVSDELVLQAGWSNNYLSHFEKPCHVWSHLAVAGGDSGGSRAPPPSLKELRLYRKINSNHVMVISHVSLFLVFFFSLSVVEFLVKNNQK